MESYKLYKKFFKPEFCSEVIKNFKSNFEYKPRGDWDSWTISNDKYKEYLIDKIKDLAPEGSLNSWINVTVYEPGGYLRMHNDLRSEHTIVINLNNNYKGGKFLIDSKKISLDTGDTLVFDGGKIEHGVEKVSQGIRYSLNFWFTANQYRINKEEKTLI